MNEEETANAVFWLCVGAFTLMFVVAAVWALGLAAGMLFLLALVVVFGWGFGLAWAIDIRAKYEVQREMRGRRR